MKLASFFRLKCAPMALRALALFIFAAGWQASAAAQPAPAQPKYALLEYMKIEPGKNAEYRKLLQEAWLPVHRERIKAKLIRGWSMYSVRYPGGTAREYDLVMVTMFDNFKDLENSTPSELVARVLPNMTLAALGARSETLRKMVRTEVIGLVESAWPSSEDPRASAAPAKYVRVDYKRIEAGKNAEYVANERKYYKPLWQAAVDAGMMRGWAVWSVRMPIGSDREYGFTTVQFFDKFEQLEGSPSRNLWEKVHPNTKSADIYGLMGTLSRTARSEVLVLQESLQ